MLKSKRTEPATCEESDRNLSSTNRKEIDFVGGREVDPLTLNRETTVESIRKRTG